MRNNEQKITYSDSSITQTITHHRLHIMLNTVSWKLREMLEYESLNFAVPNAVEYVNGCVAVSGAHSDGNNMPIIRKKERDYEGMFEFRKEDINVIIRHLVIG